MRIILVLKVQIFLRVTIFQLKPKFYFYFPPLHFFILLYNIFLQDNDLLAGNAVKVDENKYS